MKEGSANKCAAGDGGIGSRFHVECPWPAAPEHERSQCMSSTSSIVVALITILVLSSCRSVRPTPISQQEATLIITDFVNQVLSTRAYKPFKMFRPEDNEIRPYPRLKLDYWQRVELSGGRWTAIHGPPEFAYGSPDDGLFIRASVGQKGEVPCLEVCKWENP